jgi:hypothetical protein
MMFAIWFFDVWRGGCSCFSLLEAFATPAVTAKNNLFFKNHCFLFCGLKKSV